MGDDKPGSEKDDRETDLRKAVYTGIMLRAIRGLYDAIEFEGRTSSHASRTHTLVVLQDVIKELDTMQAIERYEQRLACDPRTPESAEKPGAIPNPADIETAPTAQTVDPIAAMPPPPALPSETSCAPAKSQAKPTVAMPKKPEGGKKIRNGRKILSVKKPGYAPKRNSARQ